MPRKELVKSLRIEAGRWNLTLRVLPLVLMVVVLKFLVHFFGLEFLALSPLFTAIISANIFLLGFLISGVLVDYKESERLPGELAVLLEAFVDESAMIHKKSRDTAATDMRRHVAQLTDAIIRWFHKKEKTTVIFEQIQRFNDHFLALESLMPPNALVRLKSEQSSLRKIITRIHTIRETSFNPSGYAIAEIITFVLILGLIMAKIDPYYESVFFVGFVSFVLVYMVTLIKSLDNPFSYYERNRFSGEVSLKPLHDFQLRISQAP
jgi:hypothetical protein